MEILIVDDVPQVVGVLSRLLKEAGYTTRATTTGELAIQSALLFPPALVLLDVRMPGLDGFEVCRRLKNDIRTSSVPVIFISGVSDLSDRVTGFEAGGVDFITKPFQREEVLARVNVQMALRNAMEQINVHNRTLEYKVEQRTHELLRERNIAQNYLDIAGVALFALDRESRITMMNKKGEEIFCVKECDIIGKLWIDKFIPKEFIKIISEKYHAQMAGRGFEYEHLTLDIIDNKLRSRVLACTSRILKDEFSNVSGMLISAEDVTEKFAAENAVKISEEKYRSYVQNAPDAIFIYDENGCYVDANPAACDLLMYSQTELLTKRIGELAPRGEELRHEMVNLAVRKNRIQIAELLMRKKDGIEISVAVKAVTLFDGRIMWFCSDISELRQAERIAVAHAKNLDRALGQLHSLTAHMHDSIESERLATATEIHDQIGALLTGANLILNQVEKSEIVLSTDGRELIGQATAIVGQALTASRGVYARLRPPMLDDFGLVETMRWYLKDWSKTTGIRERHNLAKLKEDPNQSRRIDLFRILQELLTNVARHAMASEIFVRLTMTKNNFVLVVNDNGVGFDFKVQQAGFGIQGIKGRLNRYSGRLDVNQTHPGTCITVTMPCIDVVNTNLLNSEPRLAK